ncbi:hypothetical protein GCM10012284_44860 [Mangrovihabitans endophyticus]|uniref:Uncharacterized protein n=1 Tax=Mangrovihabitans endophyticus TaxID=1751298 RepID=A0A8J3C1V4_9ACTN|nr:hypothetical protein GCM10012284_44860 [Mangrovihabitans endophyticus]
MLAWTGKTYSTFPDGLGLAVGEGAAEPAGESGAEAFVTGALGAADGPEDDGSTKRGVTDGAAVPAAEPQPARQNTSAADAATVRTECTEPI